MITFVVHRIKVFFLLSYLCREIWVSFLSSNSVLKKNYLHTHPIFFRGVRFSPTAQLNICRINLQKWQENLQAHEIKLPKEGSYIVCRIG